MKTEKELQEIYSRLDENEKFGLSFGIFPIRLDELELGNYDYAELIRISQKESKVVY